MLEWAIKYWKYIAGTLLAMILIASLSLYFAPSDPLPGDDGVVAEWNDAISRLGIEPVFPPEEDIYVGDVFALLTDDNRPNDGSKKSEPSLNRAIKLDHVDMTNYLNDNYKALPIFPDTLKCPADSNEPCIQKSNDKGVFSNHEARGVLTVAAFPGYTIHHTRSSSGGLSALGNALHLSRQQDDLLEVKIPFAESYGVPSMLATGRLKTYCEDSFQPGVCNEITLRQQLSFVNKSALETFTNKEGKTKFAFNVEVVLVNRVYLTRSIEETRNVGDSSDAKLRAIADAADQVREAAKISSPVDSTSSAPQTSNPKSGQPNSTEAGQGSADLLKQVQAGAVNGALSILSKSSTAYELKQTFVRPIVIGYRAVRYHTDDTNVLDNAPALPVTEKK